LTNIREVPLNHGIENTTTEVGTSISIVINITGKPGKVK